MIIGYIGTVRQGKTFSAVQELKKFYDRGYKIYSNTWLSFPHETLTIDYILDIIEQDLDIPDKSIFFIDEFHIWFDSRISGSKRNRMISYFLLQTGKMGESSDYGLILFFTTQFLHQIDKRLRSLIDICVECEKHEFHDNKYFRQLRYYNKGSKSFTSLRVVKGTKEKYSLYDTRKKIKYEKDRYKEE